MAYPTSRGRSTATSGPGGHPLHRSVHRPHWQRGSEMADDCRVHTDRDDALTDASRIIARAQADAEAIRREALVTAEGIRQIALEDARSIDLPGTAPREPARDPAAVDAALGDLATRVERIERK